MPKLLSVLFANLLWSMRGRRVVRHVERGCGRTQMAEEGELHCLVFSHEPNSAHDAYRK